MPKAKAQKASAAKSRRAPRGGASSRRRARSRPRSPALAHDIRTPLTGILALAELLHASDLPERERRWAAAIKGAADHLARLTTLVVDAAKADAAGLVLRAEPFSPRELARVGRGLARGARRKPRASTVEVAIARQPAGARDRRSRCGCAARWKT